MQTIIIYHVSRFHSISLSKFNDTYFLKRTSPKKKGYVDVLILENRDIFCSIPKRLGSQSSIYESLYTSIHVTKHQMDRRFT